ncbi:hypothetical protein [Sphingobium phenoxybenzoativorans]|uniref:hypothetical protein n=1 Tax=Sphingobium phenoxybenzoativorans TaxID=1592790 RepID=UPI001112FF66|nr:hypothetical protein [Sphingobium phenoxybenzoativorans]
MSKKVSKQTGCIFCNGGPLSKEHIWAKWAHQIIPSSPFSTIKSVSGDIISEAKKINKDQRRQGGTKNITTGRICMKCNSGWMSRLENEIKNTFSPLIQGHPVKLERHDLSKIFRYVCVKVCVIDSRDKLPALDKNFVQAIYSETDAPGRIQIYLSKTETSDWGSGLKSYSTGYKPASDERITIASYTWGLGKLLIHILYCSSKKIEVEVCHPGLINILAQITSKKELNWPPSYVFTANDADYVAQSLAILHRAGFPV